MAPLSRPFASLVVANRNPPKPIPFFFWLPKRHSSFPRTRSDICRQLFSRRSDWLAVTNRPCDWLAVWLDLGSLGLLWTRRKLSTISRVHFFFFFFCRMAIVRSLSIGWPGGISGNRCVSICAPFHRSPPQRKQAPSITEFFVVTEFRSYGQRSMGRWSIESDGTQTRAP